MYFKDKNMTIYYEKFGSKKPTIIILPGWGNTRNTFQNIINYFKDKYTIYIIDYPGFGNSLIPSKELTILDYSETIKNFLTKKNIKKPIIIAHSFGGRITTLLISKYHIKAQKIILIDVAGIKRRKKLNIWFKEKTYKFLKLASNLFSKEKQSKIKHKLLTVFASSDYQKLPSNMRKTFQNIIKLDLRKYYKNINVETLILWGENDQSTPLKDAYYIRKQIKKSALIIFKETDHFPYLSYPYQTNIIIESFLKEK